MTRLEKHTLINQLWQTTDLTVANIAALVGCNSKTAYYHINYCKCNK